MDKKQIRHRHAHIYTLEHLFTLEEIDRIRLHPQKHNKWIALTPEATVVVCNEVNCFLGIHLALATDGLIYSSYTLTKDDGGGSSWPSLRREVTPGKTIRKALRNCLEKLRGYSHYNGAPEDRKIRQIIDDTLRGISERSLYQMSIFDMLGPQR